MSNHNNKIQNWSVTLSKTLFIKSFAIGDFTLRLGTLKS